MRQVCSDCWRLRERRKKEAIRFAPRRGEWDTKTPGKQDNFASRVFFDNIILSMHP
jgi:hypothetical protein